MSNLVLLIVAILTTIVGILLILQRTKENSDKNKKVKIALYFLLIIGIIYISVSLLGGPLLKK